MRSTGALSAADEERDDLESLPRSLLPGHPFACSSWAKMRRAAVVGEDRYSQGLKLDWVPPVVADGLAKSPLAKSRIRRSRVRGPGTERGAVAVLPRFAVPHVCGERSPPPTPRRGPQAHPTGLPDIYGIGPVITATILGQVGDVTRFRDRHQFASYK